MASNSWEGKVLDDLDIIATNPPPQTISPASGAVFDVHVVNSSSSSLNLYSEALVPYATPTTILTYTVTAATFNVFGVYGWGDTNGEFLVLVNGVVKGGGRTSAADPNFHGDYSTAGIPAVMGDVITITAEHYNAATHTMKANLLGG